MEGNGAARGLDEIDRWSGSGLLALTGWPGAAARPPAGLLRGLDTLVDRLVRASSARGGRVEVAWEELLLGRAALRGFVRQGRRSANGSCRLLAAASGWVALNLPRPDDLDLLEALVEVAPVDELDDWLRASVALRDADALVERGRLLGLPISRLAAPMAPSDPPSRRIAARLDRPKGSPLRVVDLSAMWAGPLCARLLGRSGAKVTKVESSERLDGARMDAPFYAWLHADDAELVVDLRSAAGRQELRELLESADVVIESARPRALAQLGLDPDSLSLAPGVVWVSITGHGRVAAPMAIAFGDDAAVAGGLVGIDAEGGPVFCGDAIADPITGLLAAVAALEALAAGGGLLLDVAMSVAAASVLSAEGWGEPARWSSQRGPGGEQIILDGRAVEVGAPRLPLGVGA